MPIIKTLICSQSLSSFEQKALNIVQKYCGLKLVCTYKIRFFGPKMKIYHILFQSYVKNLLKLVVSYSYEKYSYIDKVNKRHSFHPNKNSFILYILYRQGHSGPNIIRSYMLSHIEWVVNCNGGYLGLQWLIKKCL